MQPDKPSWMLVNQWSPTMPPICPTVVHQCTDFCIILHILPWSIPSKYLCANVQYIVVCLPSLDASRSLLPGCLIQTNAACSSKEKWEGITEGKNWDQTAEVERKAGSVTVGWRWHAMICKRATSQLESQAMHSAYTTWPDTKISHFTLWFLRSSVLLEIQCEQVRRIPSGLMQTTVPASSCGKTRVALTAVVTLILFRTGGMVISNSYSHYCFLWRIARLFSSKPVIHCVRTSGRMILEKAWHWGGEGFKGNTISLPWMIWGVVQLCWFLFFV